VPRRNHRRTDDSSVLDDERVRRAAQVVQEHRDGDWVVRTVPGGASAKTYRCPGCDHEIRPGSPHVVAWPADWRGDLSDRRHWHAPCWQARDRRR